MARKVASLDDLNALSGAGEFVSDWLLIDQAMVDGFAELTGDRQWIHVDLARAAASPFGGTIAHGLLILSLAPRFLTEVLDFVDRRVAVNYGYDKVRFTAPVRTGQRVRGAFAVDAIDPVGADQARCTYLLRIEIEGAERPALVARWQVQMGW